MLSGEVLTRRDNREERRAMEQWRETKCSVPAMDGILKNIYYETVKDQSQCIYKLIRSVYRMRYTKYRININNEDVLKKKGKENSIIVL